AERRRRLSATRDVACRPNVESRGVRRAPRPISRGSTRVEAANQGGGDRIRTDDFRRAKAALCQLSYAPWGGEVSHGARDNRAVTSWYPPGQPPVVTTRPPPPVGRIVLGAVLVVGGVAWLLDATNAVDIPWEAGLCGALVLVGGTAAVV